MSAHSASRAHPCTHPVLGPSLVQMMYLEMFVYNRVDVRFLCDFKQKIKGVTAPFSFPFIFISKLLPVYSVMDSGETSFL